jgi:acetyl-CoA carboxylase biotin carboxyl carrier protein
LEIKVTVGKAVSEGDEVAIVESMKMEVPVTSTAAGKVAAIKKNVGDFVNDGDVLIELS